MYPRNAASPERISIGAVVQISDGAVQTAGVAVKVIPFGGSEANGAGTVAYSADGVVLYTPTQAETNYTSLILVASKAGCIPATVTVVTSAAGIASMVTSVYAALPADHTVAGSYGARFLLALNSNRTLQLTGSYHAAAVVHEIQPDAITAAAISADAVTEIQAGLATLQNQITIAAYIDTEVAAIKAVTDKLNTGLVADGQLFQFTANMLELAPAGGGGGGSGDATQANQVLILDQLDVIQAKTDLIGNAAALVAVASLQPGTITSFPETLRAGDSYTTENGRAITVQLLDTNGDPIEQSGSLLFTNATVEFKIRRAGETDSSRIIVGTAEVTNPAGTGENQGPYVTIELASEETAKGLVKYRYTGLLTFTWPGTSDEVVSFETGQVTFNN